jgi:membrane protease YdiL (CAAX protease family)
MSPRPRTALAYVGLAFGLSWLIFGVYAASGGSPGGPPALAMALAYMLMPAVAAFVVQRLVAREAVAVPLGVSFRINRWFFVAWLLPALLAVATIGVSVLLPGVELSLSMEGMFDRLAATLSPGQLAEMRGRAEALPVHPFWLALAYGLIAGVTINAVAGFGEELGWRGLLHKELAGLGFYPSSLLTGLVWGVWHAPLVLQGLNYPQHPRAGVALMTAWCVLLAPLFRYVRVRSRSVIAASVLHGSLNGCAGLAIMVVRGGSDLIQGMTGLSGFVVLAAANAALFAYDRIFEPAPITR